MRSGPPMLSLFSSSILVVLSQRQRCVGSPHPSGSPCGRATIHNPTVPAVWFSVTRTNNHPPPPASRSNQTPVPGRSGVRTGDLTPLPFPWDNSGTLPLPGWCDWLAGIRLIVNCRKLRGNRGVSHFAPNQEPTPDLVFPFSCLHTDGRKTPSIENRCLYLTLLLKQKFAARFAYEMRGVGPNSVSSGSGQYQRW